MDIYDTIKSDHQKVLHLCQQMLETTPRATKRRSDLFGRLRQALMPHMQAEEQYFYPFLRQNSEDPELVFMALEEHLAAEAVLHDEELTAVDDASWHAKIQVLQELLEHHIQEEESDVFDALREIIDDKQARDMAKEFQARRKHALSELQHA